MPKKPKHYEEDTNFLNNYFDIVAKLLNPLTGQPINRHAHMTRERMRNELYRIRREREKEPA